MKIIVEFESLPEEKDTYFEKRFMCYLAKIKTAKITVINKIPSGAATYDLIEKSVCEFTSKYYSMEITPELISTAKRKREVVIARQLCYHISKNKFLGSWDEIGKRFGNKDHATAMYGNKTVNNLLQTNTEFRNQFQSFIESFK